MNENKPLREIRVGRVCASVWRNEYERDGEKQAFLSTTIRKLYTDKSGQWRSSTRFSRRELEDAAKVIQDVLDYVALVETQEWRVHDTGKGN
jgi:hypothetical protein